MTDSERLSKIRWKAKYDMYAYYSKHDIDFLLKLLDTVSEQLKESEESLRQLRQSNYD